MTTNINRFLKCMLFISIILASPSYAQKWIEIDKKIFFPCTEECKDWIYRTDNIGIKYAEKEAEQLDLVSLNWEGGDYKITVCGNGPDGNSDSIYVGMDNAVITTIDLKLWMLNKSRCSSDIQNGGVAIVNIPAGTHTIQLWAREDGLVVTDIKFEKQ